MVSRTLYTKKVEASNGNDFLGLLTREVFCQTVTDVRSFFEHCE